MNYVSSIGGIRYPPSVARGIHYFFRDLIRYQPSAVLHECVVSLCYRAGVLGMGVDQHLQEAPDQNSPHKVGEETSVEYTPYTGTKRSVPLILLLVLLLLLLVLLLKLIFTLKTLLMLGLPSAPSLSPRPFAHFYQKLAFG